MEIWVFLFFVFYVLIAGLTLQMVVLPLTPWHAGDGLMVGGDWILFQEVALNHVALIREFGWSVAQLRPEGHGPSGLAAYIYVITGVSKPWVLLPIHGVVYALGAVGLFWVIEGLCGSKRLALFALTPMFLMPSLSMAWGQLHKDVWAISAVLLLLGFWFRLFVGRHLSIWITFTVLIFVNFSVWWMRSYALQIIFLGQCVLLIFMFFISLNKRVFKPLIIGIVALIFNYVVLINSVSTTASTPASGDYSSDFCKDWKRTLSSASLENAFMGIACTRDRVMSYTPHAKSNVDTDVQFSTAKDVLLYVPRAAQVGVLSPFPNIWFGEVGSTASQIYRLAAAIETSIMYVALFGVLLMLCLLGTGRSGVTLDKTVAFVALLGFSMVWVVAYTLATGNVGSLYRVRFPIMLLWLGLGVWSWSEILVWRRAKSKEFNETHI
jgi:hypothetical protein